MTQELAFDRANKAKEWLVFSLSISSAGKVSFGNIHDRFFTKYGPNFMAHVYRTAMGQVLPNLPDSTRSQLLDAVQQAVDEAIHKQAHALPMPSDCSACHSRKF